MDKLKKTIELIGSHQNVLSHYVVDPGVNLTTQEMFDVLIKEIEQYKHTLTHDTKEIKLLTAEIDQKDEEIERLRGAIIKTVQDAEVREEKLDKEIERLRIERDYWKTTLIAELEENESGDGVDNEMHEHEKALQQALKEGK